MGYSKHMYGYDHIRTLYHFEQLELWKEGAFFYPIVVEVSPSHTCNQRCRHCYARKRGETGNMLHFRNLFHQLQDVKVQAIEIQGTGEPLLNENLLNEIKHCKIPMGLVTNGVLLAPEIQDYILGNLTYVKFSVIDSEPVRYCYVHGCDIEQWNKLITNIAYAAKLRETKKLSTALVATVYLDKSNFNNAYEIVAFFKELGLDYIVVQEATFSYSSPAGTGTYASLDFDPMEIDEMKLKVHTLDDDNFKSNIRFPLNTGKFHVGIDCNTWKPGYCEGIKFSTLIGSDGEVYPCWRMWGRKEYSYGSIYKHTFRQIWGSEQRKAIQDYILKVPPEGIGTDSECNHCNITKLNDILWAVKTATTKWKGFLVQ